jgi:flagellar protein FlaG
MVKVMDKEDGKVIREIPPEKTLDLVAKLWELAGILVDERR